jgi:hypothetical protein
MPLAAWRDAAAAIQPARPARPPFCRLLAPALGAAPQRTTDSEPRKPSRLLTIRYYIFLQ